jgi:oxygen-dependent protoporphyrinogen oxidase
MVWRLHHVKDAAPQLVVPNRVIGRSPNRRPCRSDGAIRNADQMLRAARRWGWPKANRRRAFEVENGDLSEERVSCASVLCRSMAVIVVGGGPAGCAAAHALQKLGHDAVLLEACEALGGRTRTISEQGFAIDTGATFILGSYRRTLALIRELGRDDEVRGVEGLTGFHDGERLHLLRAESPPSYARLSLLSLRDKARLAARSMALAVVGPSLFDLDSFEKADGSETVESWARAKLGERPYQYVVRPGIEPLWCFSCEEPTHALLLALTRAVWRVPPWRPRLVCLAGGIGSLCNWLSIDVDVRCGRRAVAVREVDGGVVVETAGGEIVQGDAAIVATDATSAAELLGKQAPPGLTAIPYGAGTHVALAYERDPWPDLPGWAFVPVGPGRRAVVGLSLLSRKSSALVPAGAEVLDVYFADDASKELRGDAIVHAARDAAVRLLGGRDPEPLFTRVFEHPRGFPIPKPGLSAVVREALDGMPARIRLAGDYITPGGIETAVRTGEQAAAEAHQALAG